MMIFKDRQAAGKLLAERLKDQAGKSDRIVLAIPRGGVVVAAEIAKKLHLPLDIVITRKIGAPSQPELALGAVDPNGEVVWDQQLLDDLGLKAQDLQDQVQSQVEEIKRRDQVYRFAKGPLAVTGQTVILVDDGVATGATIISAIYYLKSLQVKDIVVAVPVAALDIAERLSKLVLEVVILHAPENLGAVGNFYTSFEPVGDDKVIQLLENRA